MRVVAGQAKGRRLKAPPGQRVRPTPAKVKEALFSILAHQIIGARILDLFAGTGSIGIEALSRGAKRAAFVEQHPDSIQTLMDNLKECDFLSRSRIHRCNALNFLRKIRPSVELYDIVFVDPPYHTGILTKLLPLLSRGGMITRTGVMIIEHFHKIRLPDRIGELYRFRTNRYGDTGLSFYRRASELKR